MHQQASKAYIGTSGYLYDHWYGVFYPDDLPGNQRLKYYSRFFDTVELNVTFYRLPLEAVFRGWYQRTPAEFWFVLKGSRLITHLKRFKESQKPLALFFQRAFGLKEKLKLVLWQLPPQFEFSEELASFCQLLATISPKTVGHAFEFRHSSWFCPATYETLTRYQYAIVLADYPFKIKLPGEKDKDEETIEVPQTAPFIYLRRHGATALYSSNYSEEELKEEAAKIQEWLKAGNDVFLYFNNDAKGYAVLNALKVKELLGERRQGARIA